MHVQDRLRAALVRKRASEVCWSCAFVRTHQIRWIRTVFTEHISQTLNSPPVEFSKYTAQDSDLSDSSKPTSSYVDGWSFRKQKVYSLPIRKVETFSPYFQRPLWRKLDSTPRQYQVYREGKGSHDTIKAQHKSNNMEPVGRRRLPDSTRASRNTSVRIRKIRESGSMKRSVAFRKVQSSRIRLMRPRFVELQKPPGALRAFRNTFVKFQKFREKGSIKRSVAMRYHRIRRRLRFVKSQKSVRLRKVGWYKPIFRKWLGLAKSHKERTRLGLLKESEELLDAYADIARSKYRINARSPRRTGAATRTRHGLNRMLQDSFNITQHVAATKDDADTKLENPMADHLVDPQESDPSENMAEQQAALSSASVNNLGQPNPLWTRSRPMGSSNAYCFGREDRFEASSIPGARLYSTQVCMQPLRYGAASDSPGRQPRVHPIPILYLHQVSKSLRSYRVSETLAFEST